MDLLKNKFAEALVLQGNKEYEKAILLYKEIVQLDSSIYQAYANLGFIYEMKNDLINAAENLEKAIQIKQDDSNLYNSLAEIYVNMGDFQKAEQCLEKSLSLGDFLNASFLRTCISLGVYYRRKNNLKKALSFIRTSVDADPSNPILRCFLSDIYLSSGDFHEGFICSEWRKKIPANIGIFKPCMEMQQWSGEPFSGKKLLVYCEQGLGDALMYIRYLPLVKARGGHVAFLSPIPLLKLLDNFPGMDCILREADLRDFDFSVSLMSLPAIFETTINNIPYNNSSYIKPDTAIVNKWKKHIDSNRLFKIGVVWSGKASAKLDTLKRSCLLTDLSPLKDIRNVAFYSLQINEAAKEISNTDPGLEITDLSPFINDFNDTAGAIMNLDLVISIDTSVAHLAGALGKAAWIALPFVAEWRWLTEREDSVWYPTLKLYRQEEEDDWNSVFVRMAKDLDKIVQKLK